MEARAQMFPAQAPQIAPKGPREAPVPDFLPGSSRTSSGSRRCELGSWTPFNPGATSHSRRRLSAQARHGRRLLPDRGSRPVTVGRAAAPHGSAASRPSAFPVLRGVGPGARGSGLRAGGPLGRRQLARHAGRPARGCQALRGEPGGKAVVWEARPRQLRDCGLGASLSLSVPAVVGAGAGEGHLLGAGSHPATGAQTLVLRRF